MQTVSRIIYERYYELEFPFICANNLSVDLIDSKLCGREICLLLKLSRCRSQSHGLSKRVIIKDKRKSKAKKITGYTTFILAGDRGVSVGDGSITGVRLIESKEKFRNECCKAIENPNHNQEFRIATSFKKLKNGNYTTYSVLKY